MTLPILPVGAFVWCRFPISEDPQNPGPEDHLHLVYIEDSNDDNSVLTIYTTSVIWDTKVPTPIGVLIVNSEIASAMGQKPFVLDARRIALLPVTNEWFPALSEPDHGILMVAEKSFQKKVSETARAAVKRPENVQLLGPKAPVNKHGWMPPGRF